MEGKLGVAELDHLVVAAATLEEGIDWVESRLRVKMLQGGKHVKMGTHNALLGLGPERYLEVIAIDPGQPSPDRPRWFSLDEPEVRNRLAGGPCLLHWVVRVSSFNFPGLDVAACFGRITEMSRGELHWKITIPDDGRIGGGGCLPSLIRWPGQTPAARLPDSGCRLDSLVITHHNQEKIGRCLEKLPLNSSVIMEVGLDPGLRAVLRLPGGGDVTLR